MIRHQKRHAGAKGLSVEKMSWSAPRTVVPFGQVGLEHLEKETSIDAQTAEQALKLAIRLQQEGGQRISMEELDRNADEAGIDRSYLRSALAQIQSEQAQSGQISLAERRRSLAIIAGVTAAATAFFASMAIAGGGAGVHVSPLAIFLIAFLLAALVARTARRLRAQGGRRPFRRLFHE